MSKTQNISSGRRTTSACSVYNKAAEAGNKESFDLIFRPKGLPIDWITLAKKVAASGHVEWARALRKSASKRNPSCELSFHAATGGQFEAMKINSWKTTVRGSSVEVPRFS